MSAMYSALPRNPAVSTDVASCAQRYANSVGATSRSRSSEGANGVRSAEAIAAAVPPASSGRPIGSGSISRFRQNFSATSRYPRRTASPLQEDAHVREPLFSDPSERNGLLSRPRAGVSWRSAAVEASWSRRVLRCRLYRREGAGARPPSRSRSKCFPTTSSRPICRHGRWLSNRRGVSTSTAARR